MLVEYLVWASLCSKWFPAFKSLSLPSYPRRYALECLPGIFFFLPHHTACRILVPRPGIEPWPWQWKHWVPTTGTPGNSHFLEIFKIILLWLGPTRWTLPLVSMPLILYHPGGWPDPPRSSDVSLRTYGFQDGGPRAGLSHWPAQHWCQGVASAWGNRKLGSHWCGVTEIIYIDQCQTRNIYLSNNPAMS